MFWERDFTDVDFIDAVEMHNNLILSNLKYLFEDYDRYLDDIANYSRIFGIKISDLKDLIDYLLLILMANTKYVNVYIKKYAEKHQNEMEKQLNNLISVWEFIKIASESKNNDLNLDRLDFSNGMVDIRGIKGTYAREVIRVKLKELSNDIKEKSKEFNITENNIIKSILEDINDYLKDKIKYEPIKGIKTLNYKGEIPLEWHPPCIRGILRDIQTGGSPSHYARRSFVVYWFCAKFNPNLRPLENGELVNISALDVATVEEIEGFINDLIDIMFKNVEDFNENKTRYYIMHNIGYKVADHLTHCEYCKNWKDDGGKGLSYYCNPDDICKRKDIIHPLDYLCYKINENSKK